MSEEPPASSSPKPKINITLLALSAPEVHDLSAWADTDEVRRFCTLDIQASIDGVINEPFPYPCLQVLSIGERRIGLVFVTPNFGKYDKCRAEIGYCLDREFLRHRFVKKALKLVIPIIFQERPGLERLDAKVDVNDRDSQRMLEKAGFQREGVLRRYRILEGRTIDVAMYSILSSDLQVGLSSLA